MPNTTCANCGREIYHVVEWKPYELWCHVDGGWGHCWASLRGAVATPKKVSE